MATAVANFNLSSLSDTVLGINAFLIVAGLAYVTLASLAWGRNTTTAVDDAAQVAATGSVGTFLTVGVAAVSVLLSGVAVLLALNNGSNPLSDRAYTELALAACWLVVSLLGGAVSASYVVTHIHDQKSIAENQLVMTFATLQLIAMVGGGIYFAISIFLF